MSRTRALVLAGHGSGRHPDAVAPLHAHADRIRSRECFDEVRTVCWREEPALRRTRAIVGSDVAYVVPVLTSEGYFADEVFPRELGLGAREPTGPELRYADPVGTHPGMAEVVADRVEAATDRAAGAPAVALVGHGTDRNPRSARATRAHVERLRERDDVAEAVALFLDEAPAVGELYDRVDADEIVVVPFFVADGGHTTRDIPDAIGHPGPGGTARVEGRRVHYTGAVGTEPAVADVVVERAVEAGAELGEPAASPVGPGPAGAALVSRVEAAGSPLTWGELSVATDGANYELRHRDDAGRAPEALRPLADPAALRDRVRTDDRGRYRPLSGARTLPRGWVLAGLDAGELVRAVRFVYPGSVTTWHAGRRGTLEPTGFPETAARQTGIYADLDRRRPDEVAATAAAVCGRCVREPRWGTGDGPPADGGGGGVARDTGTDGSAGGAPADASIPCAEPCPFLLSATHAFADVDADEPASPDPDVPDAMLETPGNEFRARYVDAMAERDPPVPSRTPPGGGR